MKQKNYTSRILYPGKIFFSNKEEIKKFSKERKLREFIGSRLALELKKKNAKGRFLETREMIPEKKENIRHKDRVTEMVNIWVNTIGFSSHVEFINFYVMIENKNYIATWLFNVCGCNIREL